MLLQLPEAVYRNPPVVTPQCLEEKTLVLGATKENSAEQHYVCVPPRLCVYVCVVSVLSHTPEPD